MKRDERKKVKTGGDQSSTTRNENPREQNERHITGNVHIQGEMVVDFPPYLKKKHDTERDDENTTEGKRFFWSTLIQVVTLVVLGFYTGFTLWQACLTQEAITNNTKQFQIEQRPYIWPLDYTAPKKEPHIVANEQMWMNIYWVNYGKSPAVRGGVTSKIFIGEDAMQQADKWFASLSGRMESASGPRLIIPPIIPSDPEKPLSNSTIKSDGPLSPTEVDYILNTDFPYAAVARFQYFDLAGNRYWSDICMSRFKVGSFPHCPANNEMH
jgi:hypothetical protein